MRLWIDIGHFDSDSGAVVGGVREVDRNVTFVKELIALAAHQGWTIGSTKSKPGRKTLLRDRVSDAAAFKADIFVSIHHDWAKGGQAVIYPNTKDTRATRSKQLADAISRRITNPKDGIPSHGVYADRRGLKVLRTTRMPAVIVEVSRVQDKYDISDMVTKVVQGICDARNLTFKAKSGSAPATTPPKVRPTPSSRPLLKSGSRGAAVKELQIALNRHGAKLKEDGLFGPLTRTAVISFQRRNRLLVDGIAGSQTWSALNTRTSSPPKPPTTPVQKPPILRMNSSGEWVRTLQRALNSRGHRLSVDGNFGPLTRAVVISFQRRAKIRADGIVGPVTWGRLGY